MAGLLFFALSIGWPKSAKGQESRVVSQRQVWLGYMTQTRFTDELSWWNDAHFVPEAFYVLRTGLSYHLAPRLFVTAGYAQLGLPVGGLTRDLKRRERRPWGQVVYNRPLGGSFGLLQRFRYDARIRRNVEGGELAPGYGFTNRGRYLITLRRDFPELMFGADVVPYANVSNEVLVHWESDYVRLDQNRLSVSLGVARGGASVQLGYMNRLVQLTSPGALGNDYIMNHTLVLWLFHNFDLRRRD